MPATDCFIAIDAGTTTSRAWLVQSGVVLAADSVAVGVRDTARDGHPGKLYKALRELVASVRRQSSAHPLRIAAAGMLTSSLGIRELPHREAPAGPAEIAEGSIELHQPEICNLPIVLFPGVRSGAWFQDEDVESTDLMRGEETLCIGLSCQRPGQPLSVLNLGSHWKAIQVSSQGQITGSWTTLSGEMLHVIMTETILASAVPAGRPESFDEEWRERGADMYRRNGLSRTLFAVRLWEVQAGERVTAEQRLAFLMGAVVAEGLDAFRRAGYLAHGTVLLIGSGGIAEAWRSTLESLGISVEGIDGEAAANAFIAGIETLLSHRCN